MPSHSQLELQFKPLPVVLGVTLLMVSCLVYQTARAYLFSPVRHVPGPFWSKVTPFPLYIATFRTRRAAYAHSLIKKYGPIVIIAPDQIHTTNDAAMKIIYDRSSIKSSFYHAMGSYKGVRQILGTIDYSSAAVGRRNLLQCFQSQNLASLADAMESHIASFLKLLHSKSNQVDPVIDGVLWFRLLTLDTVTDILWGQDHDLLADMDMDNTKSELLRKLHHFSQYMALEGFIPFFEAWTRLVGSQKYKQMRDDCYSLDGFARDALETWNDRETKGHEKDVLSMLLTMKSKQEESESIARENIPAYIIEMMAAGSSTTSNTAAIACWVLARHQAVQTKLQQELFTAFPDPGQIDMRQCLNLNYLDSVIFEVMRLWPIVPGPLERHVGQSLTVNGMAIPAGTLASCAAYDQGRREDIFSNANTFDPSRWLKADAAMKKNWIPFGYGSRSCPGQNLGMTELKYFLAAIFRYFSSVVPQGRAEDILELRDVFTASIWITSGITGKPENKCWLQFSPIAEKVIS
ncbi:putative sterigmatocystin biosynthesis monooxygenase STCB [Cyphellophora attinorum]|uniref:Putative sterigmatocystin biosynthesis monooxygenase STCB n=1 Tax=Cyphellophora attinorum TaxID=1664694 RepID=A0A0N0NHX1_9EURO|nr:putative sterigmatocystin biosynthesis monooxygenase STCB [Phialophora attinorum]KPI34769.1 putative sterigmatocystin biosynthesis monooxygenase STCB [Phialophora attinorum]